MEKGGQTDGVSVVGQLVEQPVRLRLLLLYLNTQKDWLLRKRYSIVDGQRNGRIGTEGDCGKRVSASVASFSFLRLYENNNKNNILM